jgi:hypothetical protein
MSGYTYERKVPTAAQREARKAFKEADAKVGMSEYERTQEETGRNSKRCHATADFFGHLSVASSERFKSARGRTWT